MEVKLGDIVKFRLSGLGAKDYTGDVTRIIPEDEKDPHCRPELNYDYVVDAMKDGRMYELQIHKHEILEVL